ncbi:MAG: hypothetical protein U0892_10615 [Pirellulales bacterium]
MSDQLLTLLALIAVLAFVLISLWLIKDQQSPPPVDFGSAPIEGDSQLEKLTRIVLMWLSRPKSKYTVPLAILTAGLAAVVAINGKTIVEDATELVKALTELVRAVK